MEQGSPTNDVFWLSQNLVKLLQIEWSAPKSKDRNMRRTKIVATLGPASDRPGVLKRLLEAGVDVCRLNFSHGSADDHRRRAKDVRAIATEIGRTVAILADLQGPKIRLGSVKEDVVVENGALLSITTNAIELGDSDLVSINYKNFPKDVSKGEKVLVDDGKFVAKVFLGKSFNEIVAEAKTIFKEVKVFKPKSSRKESKESFIICKKLR